MRWGLWLLGKKELKVWRERRGCGCQGVAMEKLGQLYFDLQTKLSSFPELCFVLPPHLVDYYLS